MLTETIQLRKGKKLSYLCHQRKNLYNLGNYYINQNYEIMEEYLNWYDTKWMLKTSEPFKAIPSQVAQNVLKNLHLAWKSTFQARKDWKKDPEKYRRFPQFPKYLEKNGEYFACFNHQHIKIKNGKLHFPKKTKLEPIEVETNQEDLQQVRIIPKNDVYNLELVYNHIETYNLNLDKNRMISIDIGVNNLACVVNNIGLQPFMINGKPLKSMNHQYNKQKTQYQSISKKVNDRYTTKRLQKLERIRYNKIKDYMHKATRYIIDYCIENDIGTIVIGKNDGWKQKVNIGKKNNQNFVQIPFQMFIDKIQYKADLIGVKIKIITEEYTSKCSFLDNELIKKHNKYEGKRISRGLFKSSNGRLINADVNASYNIMKKAFPNAINADGIKGAQLHPLLINLNSKSRSISIKTPQNRSNLAYHTHAYGETVLDKINTVKC